MLTRTLLKLETAEERDFQFPIQQQTLSHTAGWQMLQQGPDTQYDNKQKICFNHYSILEIGIWLIPCLPKAGGYGYSPWYYQYIWYTQAPWGLAFVP